MRNSGFSGYDNVIYIGTNGKMTEAAAAMGLTNLDSLDTFIDVNRRNYLHYETILRDVPGLSLLSYSSEEKSNFQYVVVEVDADRFGLSRDDLVATLHAENVLARRYFFPGCHRMQPYRTFFPHAGLLLPETESLVRRVMILPTGTSVSEQDITAIGGVLRAARDAAPEIRQVLRQQASS